MMTSLPPAVGPSAGVTPAIDRRCSTVAAGAAQRPEGRRAEVVYRVGAAVCCREPDDVPLNANDSPAVMEPETSKRLPLVEPGSEFEQADLAVDGRVGVQARGYIGRNPALKADARAGEAHADADARKEVGIDRKGEVRAAVCEM